MNLSLFIAKRVAASGQKSFTRTILIIAVVAVAVSVAVMLIATSLVKGFKTEVSSKMFGFWGHIHIVSAVSTTSIEPIPIPKNPDYLVELRKLDDRQWTTDNGKDSAKRENISSKTPQTLSVTHVQAFATKAGIIKTKNDFEGIVLKGVGEDFDWTFVEKCLVEGRRISYQPSAISSQLSTNSLQPSAIGNQLPRISADSMMQYSKLIADSLKLTATLPEVIISQSTANRLFLKIGDKFSVHFIRNNAQEQKTFTIVGIYKTGLEEYDKKFAIVPLIEVQKLLGWTENQVAGFEVFVNDLDNLKPINNYIYKEIIPNDLLSQTIREEQPAIFDWLDLQDVNERVILILMLVVCIINMITVLLILILERTNMVGILKSLGAGNGTVQRIFLIYGVMIVGVGVIGGNILGLGLVWLEKTFKFIKLTEADYYLSYAPVQFDWWRIASINLGTWLLTGLFLLLPTYLILKITPVKALRFK